MMKFSEDNIITCDKKTKDEMLRAISHYAKQLSFTDNEEQLYQDFLTRESEGVTGLQDGFAIPHAKSEAVKQSTVLFVRNQHRILDWETFDNKGVESVFALLVPKEESGSTHIEMLSKLATALMDEDFIQKIKSTNDRNILFQIIYQEMNGVKQ